MELYLKDDCWSHRSGVEKQQTSKRLGDYQRASDPTRVTTKVFTAKCNSKAETYLYFMTNWMKLSNNKINVYQVADFSQ